MVLLGVGGGRPEGDRIVAQASAPQIPVPPPAQNVDWGFALIICGLVGANLWQLLQKMMTSESDQQVKLMTGLMAQNQTMLQALVSQNQLLIEVISKK